MQLNYSRFLLSQVGSFIVRNSATHPDCCALSVRVPGEDNAAGIIHYLIQRTTRGVKLKVSDSLLLAVYCHLHASTFELHRPELV